MGAEKHSFSKERIRHTKGYRFFLRPLRKIRKFLEIRMYGRFREPAKMTRMKAEELQESQCGGSESDGVRKIAFLVPITSNGRSYKTVGDTDFFKTLYPGFLHTKEPGFEYKFYIGYDSDDPFFTAEVIQHEFRGRFGDSASVSMVECVGLKGAPALIWNLLFQEAVKDDFDYFFQIGDDVKLCTPGWTGVFVQRLKELDYLGVVGPRDLGLSRVLTQSFVHKTHWRVFGTYFPKKIRNWYCDDWITHVYRANATQFTDVLVENDGGGARYAIDRPYWRGEVVRGYKAIKRYRQNKR